MDPSRGLLDALEDERAAKRRSSTKGVVDLSDEIHAGPDELKLRLLRRERQLTQLREADRMKSDFVSMVAHELKDPMTTVVGYGGVLRDQWREIPDAKRDVILDVVARESQRLARLVDDLLDVCRIDAGAMTYRLQPLWLQALVTEVVHDQAALLDGHDAVVEIGDDVPPVLGDPDRIRQVFVNLLSNAARHSEPGSRITVSARSVDLTEGRVVEVAVRDEGIGIDRHDHDRIFNRFAVLAKPGWVNKGTGLGLYITKQIVEAHGGRICVDSEKGNGATFFVTLEAAPTQPGG